MTRPNGDAKPQSGKAVPPKPAQGLKFRRYFRHYRTGKVMDAVSYGHKAWPIGKR